MVLFEISSWRPLLIMDLRSNVGEQRIPEPASVSFQPGLDDQFEIHT